MQTLNGKSAELSGWGHHPLTSDTYARIDRGDKESQRSRTYSLINIIFRERAPIPVLFIHLHVFMPDLCGLGMAGHGNVRPLAAGKKQERTVPQYPLSSRKVAEAG